MRILHCCDCHQSVILASTENNQRPCFLVKRATTIIFFWELLIFGSFKISLSVITWKLLWSLLLNSADDVDKQVQLLEIGNFSLKTLGTILKQVGILLIEKSVCLHKIWISTKISLKVYCAESALKW